MNEQSNSFNPSSFAVRQQRDIERLLRGAWGVGGTHEWFRQMQRPQQQGKVREWVHACLMHATERRAPTVCI